jgi:hypothetical protein
MPVSYTIDVPRRFVVTTVTGTVSVADMAAYQRALAADPDFSPMFDSLSDFTDSEPFQAEAAEIRQLAENMPFRAGARRAFVASSDLHYGLSRMAQVYTAASGVEAQVFRDRASALAWLGRE